MLIHLAKKASSVLFIWTRWRKKWNMACICLSQQHLLQNSANYI